ncbi:hypothetical protein NYE70_11600 [Paenibacillus sp. FSL R5-0407]|uniref:hypothetical protein n=1 Tax=Paenibacillus sp. FSL R5-0407 TaxID=2975320 RepID=UPI0030F6F826
MSEATVKVDELQDVKQAGTVIKLSRPVVWEDVEHKELILKFDDLSGDDFIDIEGDFLDFVSGKKNVFMSYKNQHPAYFAVIAAKASGVHPNLMKKLSGKDFLKVTGAARDFLSVMV